MADPYHNISQGLQLAENPILHIPNDTDQRVLRAMDAGFQDVKGRINALGVTINAQFDLLSLRLANAAAAGHTNVRYPQGIANNGNLPVTKNDITNMSGMMADHVALALGIPMPNGLTAAGRRRVVAEAGKTCLLVRVPADAESLTLPPEFQSPVAVASRFLDDVVSHATSPTSADGCTPLTPSAEDTNKPEGDGSVNVTEKEEDEPQQLQSGAKPLGRTPSGLMGFLNSYQNPWSRFAYSKTTPTSSAQPTPKSEDAPSEEHRIPGSLPLATTAARSTRTQRTYPLSTVIIVALIAFLIGSLLRSLLSPADFVLVPDTSSDLSVAAVVGPEIGHGAHPKEAWRELRRLFELKYIFGGWDFQIAMVRRH